MYFPANIFLGLPKKYSEQSTANIYLFKVNYKNTRKKVKVNDKVTRTTSALFWCLYD